MEHQQLKEQIQKLISQNKTEKAIKLLSNIQLSEVDKKLIILKSQYSRVKEELMLNIISRDEGERKVNQINMALLNLSYKIEPKGVSEVDSQVDASPKQGFKLKYLWIALIPILAILGYVGYSNLSNSNTVSESDGGIKKLQNDNSLVVYFPFNTLPDEVPKDYREGESRGEFRLVENKKGIENGALMFDDYKSSFKFNKALIPDDLKNYSIVFWMKPAAVQEVFIYGQYHDIDESDLNHRLMNLCNNCLSIREGKMLFTSVEDGGKKIANKQHSQTDIRRDTWTHIALIREGNEMKLYINFTKTSWTLQFNPYNYPGFSPSVTVIGKRLRTIDARILTESFEGGLDEFYLFKRVLKEKEIEILFNAGK